MAMGTEPLRRRIGCARRPAAHARACLVRIAILVFHVWPERRRQRAQLLAMEQRELRDIGLTRDDVLHECRKPFWR